jgi:hypothetical protein
MTAATSVLMIRPAAFGFNPETANSNAFQQPYDILGSLVSEKARIEFNRMLDYLNGAGINVRLFDDLPTPVKPDAVFPNNWISMHPDGTVVVYPMLAPNRRLEFRQDILDFLINQYHVRNILDLRFFEKENKFLEGTGSICFSHQNKKMFVSVSLRSNPDVARYLSDVIGYDTVFFHAMGPGRNPVYHTNVVLNFCHDLAILCTESVFDKKEKDNLINQIAECGYKIMEINFRQMISFCGNVLSLFNEKGEGVLIVSNTAYDGFDNHQKDILGNVFGRVIVVPVPSIEKYGGGSVRCMMGEIFLPAKTPGTKFIS